MDYYECPSIRPELSGVNEFELPFAFNKTRRSRVFDVTAFVTAYIFDNNPVAEPYWERYEFAQIFMVLEGRGTYTTEHGVYPVEAGMMFYRPARCKSSYAWESEQVKYALISFECHSPAMAGLGEAPIRLYEEEVATLMDVIRTAVRICEPVKASEQVSGMRVRDNVPDVVLSFIYSSLERFLAIVYCRLRKIDLLLDESQKVSRFMDSSRLVAQAREYLMAHVHEQLTVREVCLHLGVSQTTLTEKFRREMNQGVMAYFTQLKVTEAKKRIQASASSIGEIAEALGFSSVNYFSKVFKRYTGVTPTEYSRHVSKRRAAASIQTGVVGEDGSFRITT